MNRKDLTSSGAAEAQALEALNKRNNDANSRWSSGLDAAFAEKLETHLLSVGNLAGLYYPEARTGGGYVVPQASASDLAKPVAQRLPPTSLRHWYGYRDGRFDDNLYLQMGLADTQAIRRIVAADGFQIMGERIMDFGCSSGRLIRHFEAEAAEAEVWGVDLHSATIHWAQAHLSPPFNFMTNTTTPHLPFEDNSFGLIFAGSVWTHIGELDDAWLLEMRRILRPGGRLYITISDQHTLSEIERLMPEHDSIETVAALDRATGMLSSDYIQFVTATTPWLQRSVYNRDAWLAKIGRWMDVRAAVPDAYGWQTGVLLAKRG